MPTDQLTAADEAKITELCAETAHFVKTSDRFYTCLHCHQRMSVYYVGKGLNERLLDHYNTKHAGAMP